MHEPLNYKQFHVVTLDTCGFALPPNPMVTTASTVVAPSWVRAGVSWPFSVFTYTYREDGPDIKLSIRLYWISNPEDSVGPPIAVSLQLYPMP